MTLSLSRQSVSVNRRSPQAEWKHVRALATNVFARIKPQVQQALMRIDVDELLIVRMIRQGASPHVIAESVDMSRYEDTLDRQVTPKLTQLYVRALGLATDTRTILKAKTPRSTFTVTNARSLERARARSGRLIVDVTRNQKEAVRKLIVQSFEKQLTPEQTARMVREVIGLTDRQMLSIDRMRQDLMAEGRSQAYISRQLDRARREAIADRASTIARTETMEAANGGQQDAWAEAKANGQLDKDLVQEVIASPDACDSICAPLDGEQAEIGGTFEGGYSGPPFHPNCECAVGLAARRD